eukprot:356981-Chlamydomonas_euryale.AAC.3
MHAYAPMLCSVGAHAYHMRCVEYACMHMPSCAVQCAYAYARPHALLLTGSACHMDTVCIIDIVLHIAINAYWHLSHVNFPCEKQKLDIGGCFSEPLHASDCDGTDVAAWAVAMHAMPWCYIQWRTCRRPCTIFTFTSACSNAVHISLRQPVRRVACTGMAGGNTMFNSSFLKEAASNGAKSFQGGCFFRTSCLPSKTFSSIGCEPSVEIARVMAPPS